MLTQYEKIAKGSMSELTLNAMKAQLKKIFLDSKSVSASASSPLYFQELHESEATNYDPHDTYYFKCQGVSRNRRPQCQPYNICFQSPPSQCPPFWRSSRGERGKNPRDSRGNALTVVQL